LATRDFLGYFCLHPSSTPLRYPGGKGKLTPFIKLVFEENHLLDGHYVEGYAGGAGIAIRLLLLEYASCIHLNDIDRSVFAFWHSVINATEELCKKIRDVAVTISQREKQRAIHADAENQSLLDLGFATFFLNRTNRSGILSGGVIGGKNQDGKWKIDARFSKTELCRRIQAIALHRTRIRLYNLDAAVFIRGVLPSLPKKSLIYLDPPFYLKAHDLYQNHYAHDDHTSIAEIVKKQISIPWIVSYDYQPEILKMYKGCRTIAYGMNYSAGKDRHRGSEIMFFAKNMLIPEVQNPAKLEAA
jgi:DNA adenine methylase